MATIGFTLFETTIGVCAIAWGANGVTACHLPERSAAAGEARMRARAPGATLTAPPTEIAAAIEAITALLGGAPRDLAAIQLDMTGVPDFHRRAYEVARAIAPGQTRTYGEIAADLGAPGAARAVGQAMGSNRFAPIVPCHRVVAAGGRTGGFSAAGGRAAKVRMLSIEGAFADEPPLLFPALPRAVRARRTR